MKPIYIHDQSVHNLSAPREVVPLIMELLQPKSVLDVGCGIGTWLKAFDESGITDYLGVDGEYVNRSMLKIPEDKFRPYDLQNSFSIGRKYDLVISLEVAEHLSESYADVFVQTLVGHGDFILFSAAIPGQDGQNHLNEQWPEYWEKKFLKHGFYFHDVIRPLIWSNELVDFWYRQNIFLVKKDKLVKRPFLTLSVVHPQLYQLKLRNEKEYSESLLEGRQGLRVSVIIFLNAIKIKIKNLFGLK